MKKMSVLLQVPLMYAFGVSQSITTDDANNTVSSCKFGSGIGREDSRISNTSVTQAQKKMSTIFTAVLEPALKKTKGLRGTLSGDVGITSDDGLTPYEMNTFMQELGCNTSQKLYLKPNIGIDFSLKINSLSGIATAITHEEDVICLLYTSRCV